MAKNELDRLRTLADYADQICSISDNNDDACRRINQLIARAEQDIKNKSLEIQLQQSHIALLKHLEGFMARNEANNATGSQIRFNDSDRNGPRAIAAEGS